MKVNILQYSMIWEGRTASKKSITDIIKKDGGLEKQSWLILPEMSITGFSMDNKITTIDKSDHDFFKDLAVKYSVYVSYGCVADGFNKMITLDTNGTVVNDYAKVHLFTYSGENKNYIAGSYKDNLYNNFIINDFNVVPAICYDLRFSYMFWPYAKQADVYAVIANWPKSRIENWKTLLKARAIENQAYVIGVNRTGVGGNIEYSGDSMVIDPTGKELLDCKDKEGLFSVEISKTLISETRKEMPFLKDRIF